MSKDGDRPGRPRTRTLLWVPILACVLAAPGSAQTLRGVLVERDSYGPISLGRVVMVTTRGDTVASVLTDENGYFSLRGEDGGRFYLVAFALGYRAIRSERIEVDEGGEKVVQLSMSPAPIPVEGVVVEGRALTPPEVFELVANGFYDRMLAGRGEFLTPQDIANADVPYTPQLFREMTRVQLLPVEDRRGGLWNDRVMIRRTMGGRTVEDRLCMPTIYVDDRWVELMPGEGLDDLVPKHRLEAVEVYRAFEAPLRYLRTTEYLDDGCGVILFWTINR